MLYGRSARIWWDVHKHLLYDVGYLFLSGCGMVTSAVHMTPYLYLTISGMLCGCSERIWCGVPEHLLYDGGYLFLSGCGITPLFIYHDFVNAVWLFRAHMVWCP